MVAVGGEMPRPSSAGGAELRECSAHGALRAGAKGERRCVVQMQQFETVVHGGVPRGTRRASSSGALWIFELCRRIRACGSSNVED